MFFNIIKKIFRARRADVSLKVFAKIFFFLILNKIFFLIYKKKSIKNSCLMIFPPSLGLGDLIMLSRIIDIIKISKSFNVEAQVIGRVEAASKKQLTIESEYGTFTY